MKRPREFLQKARIERVKRLLEMTKDSLDDVVHRVGYEDVSSFRRLFTREIGISPSEISPPIQNPPELAAWTEGAALQAAEHLAFEVMEVLLSCVRLAVLPRSDAPRPHLSEIDHRSQDTGTCGHRSHTLAPEFWAMQSLNLIKLPSRGCNN